MERIPRPGSRDVVFFMHGIMDSAMTWVSAGGWAGGWAGGFGGEGRGQGGGRGGQGGGNALLERGRLGGRGLGGGWLGDFRRIVCGTRPARVGPGWGKLVWQLHACRGRGVAEALPGGCGAKNQLNKQLHKLHKLHCTNRTPIALRMHGCGRCHAFAASDPAPPLPPSRTRALLPSPCVCRRRGRLAGVCGVGRRIRRVARLLARQRAARAPGCAGAAVGAGA